MSLSRNTLSRHGTLFLVNRDLLFIINIPCTCVLSSVVGWSWFTRSPCARGPILTLSPSLSRSRQRWRIRNGRRRTRAGKENRTETALWEAPRARTPLTAWSDQETRTTLSGIYFFLWRSKSRSISRSIGSESCFSTPVSSVFFPPIGVLRPASLWPLTYRHALQLLWTRSSLRTTEKARNRTTFPAALAPTTRRVPTDTRTWAPLFPQGDWVLAVN